MSKVICFCPTHRDHRELAALANGLPSFQRKAGRHKATLD